MAAVEALSHWGQKATDALGALLDAGDVEARWWAIRALAEIEDTEAKMLLKKGLQDTDAMVQYCAALALREHPDVEAIPYLVELLESDDHLLARLACDALAAGGKADTPALLGVLEKGKPAARIEAVRALAKIGDKETIPALLKVLEDGSAMITHWANEGLEKMGVGMVFFHSQ